MLKIAINGFGRIGRAVFRTIQENYQDQVEVVAINTSGSMTVEGWAHFLKYDTVYGRFSKNVETLPPVKSAEIGRIKIGDKVWPILAEREPVKIPWSEYGVTTVLECAGVFCDHRANDHCRGSVKKVILSAPPKKDDIPVYLMGVNAVDYQGEKLISNGSCTTNCVAPIVKVMDEEFGFEESMMITVHAYTASQRVVDGSHKDWRRGRAAAQNLVPTGTGAARSVIAAYPAVKGRFAASAIRAPIICGSYATFIFKLNQTVTVDAVNQVFENRARGDMKNIIEISYEPLVSTDIIGNPSSAVLDSIFTKVIDEDLVYLSAWYDNEWAYACRLVELAVKINLQK